MKIFEHTPLELMLLGGALRVCIGVPAHLLLLILGLIMAPDYDLNDGGED